MATEQGNLPSDDILTEFVSGLIIPRTSSSRTLANNDQDLVL